MEEENIPSMRNPIAKALRSPHLRKQILKPKKGPGSYDRKKSEE